MPSTWGVVAGVVGTTGRALQNLRFLGPSGTSSNYMGASFHYVAISCYLSYTKRITANSLPTWDLGGKHPNYPCVSAFALRVHPDEGPLTDIYVTEATYICFLKTLNPVPSMFRPHFHVRVKHPCRFFFLFASSGYHNSDPFFIMI